MLRLILKFAIAAALLILVLGVIACFMRGYDGQAIIVGILAYSVWHQNKYLF